MGVEDLEGSYGRRGWRGNARSGEGGRKINRVLAGGKKGVNGTRERNSQEAPSEKWTNYLQPERR